MAKKLVETLIADGRQDQVLGGFLEGRLFGG